VDADEEEVALLAARFCQAAADLERMGYVQRASRRGGNAMVRLAFQPDMQ
jgi:hypothetical protein